MNTAIKNFAPSVLSFLVLVVGAVQVAVASGPLDGVTIAQLVVLTITTFTTWLAPLLGERWRGKVKTGLELVGVAVTLAIPFIASGTITWAEGLLVVVAFMKAGAAELGVQIRTEPVEAPVVRTESGPVFNISTLDADRAADMISKVVARPAAPEHRGK